MPEILFDHTDLKYFAGRILTEAGLEEAVAATVAETLVEADLMGHTTHGLQLLKPYVKELEKGTMTSSGNPEIINDAGAALAWDGGYLAGPWLVHRAIDLALERIADHPVVTVTIRKSHHIGSLASYPERATRRGLMMLLTCSDPKSETVAPFGGLRPVYSPNPIAAGIPTETDPIIFDISMSATANGLVMRSREEGKKLDGRWLLDSEGNPTDDPEEFYKDPPATVLPLGGTDLGYKGFALGLLVEALTNALGGFGRYDHPDRWGSSVFLQVIDPDAFGGREYFFKEMQHLANACIATATPPQNPPVRLPGSRAMALKKQQLTRGVALYPTIVPALRSLSEKFKVPLPKNK